MKQRCLVLLFILFAHGIMGYAQHEIIIEGVYDGGYCIGEHQDSMSSHSSPVFIAHHFIVEKGKQEVLVQQLYPQYKVKRGDSLLVRMLDLGITIYHDHIGTNIHFEAGKRYQIVLDEGFPTSYGLYDASSRVLLWNNKKCRVKDVIVLSDH